MELRPWPVERYDVGGEPPSRENERVGSEPAEGGSAALRAEEAACSAEVPCGAPPLKDEGGGPPLSLPLNEALLPCEPYPPPPHEPYPLPPPPKVPPPPPP